MTSPQNQLPFVLEYGGVLQRDGTAATCSTVKTVTPGRGTLTKATLNDGSTTNVTFESWQQFKIRYLYKSPLTKDANWTTIKGVIELATTDVGVLASYNHDILVYPKVSELSALNAQLDTILDTLKTVYSDVTGTAWTPS